MGGHTGPNVRQAVQGARGGCLFLAEIENNRKEVLVIMAGYKDKMNHLLVQDPGLSRRFPIRINLPDYTPAELSLIVKKVAIERFGCQLEEGLLVKLERLISEQHKSEIHTQNASLAVGLVEQAVERMTSRLMADGEKSLNAKASRDIGCLTAADFQISD